MGSEWFPRGSFGLLRQARLIYGLLKETRELLFFLAGRRRRGSADEGASQAPSQALYFELAPLSKRVREWDIFLHSPFFVFFRSNSSALRAFRAARKFALSLSCARLYNLETPEPVKSLLCSICDQKNNKEDLMNVCNARIHSGDWHTLSKIKGSI